jgi:hypothetical protein
MGLERIILVGKVVDRLGVEEVHGVLSQGKKIIEVRRQG